MAHQAKSDDLDLSGMGHLKLLRVEGGRPDR